MAWEITNKVGDLELMKKNYYCILKSSRDQLQKYTIKNKDLKKIYVTLIWLL